MKLAVFLLLLLLINCPGNSSNKAREAAPARRAPLNQEFKIRVGEEVVFKRENLAVRLVSVLEDSRCPKGAQCITQGNGKIELQLKKSQKKPVTLELNTAFGTQKADYEGYEVKFVGLDPYPKMGGSIKPEDYVVTVLVTKNSSSRESSTALL